MAESARDRILDAASRLFAHYGYKRATVDAIAAEAGVAKGSVYLHFQSKEDVFGAVSERLCTDILAHMNATADSGLPVEAKLHEMFLAGLLDVWDFRSQAPHSVELWAEVLAAAEGHAETGYAVSREIVARVIAEGQASGVFDASLDPEQTAWLLQVALQGFESPYVLVRDREQISRSVPALLELLIRGMKNKQISVK